MSIYERPCPHSSLNATLSPSPLYFFPHFQLLPYRPVERKPSTPIELEEGEVKTEQQIHLKRGIKCDKETGTM